MSHFLLTDFLVIVLIDVVIGLIKLIIIKSGLVSLSYHIMKVNHVLLPELNQGPADLQSAALTTGLCTLEILITIVADETYNLSRSCRVQSNKQRSAQQ